MGGMADRGATLFGTLLRRYRGARALTQAGLAERSGLSVQAISMLERGARRAPRTTTIELLAQALTLDASEREALHAAARDGAAPGSASAERAPTSLEPLGGRRPAGEPRGRRRSTAIGALLLTALIVALPPVWWRSREATFPVANL